MQVQQIICWDVVGCTTCRVMMICLWYILQMILLLHVSWCKHWDACTDLQLLRMNRGWNASATHYVLNTVLDIMMS